MKPAIVAWSMRLGFSVLVASASFAASAQTAPAATQAPQQATAPAAATPAPAATRQPSAPQAPASKLRGPPPPKAGERRRPTYASCNRVAHQRNLHGGARRRFLIRCKLGYERPRTPQPAPARQP